MAHELLRHCKYLAECTLAVDENRDRYTVDAAEQCLIEVPALFSLCILFSSCEAATDFFQLLKIPALRRLQLVSDSSGELLECLQRTRTQLSTLQLCDITLIEEADDLKELFSLQPDITVLEVSRCNGPTFWKALTQANPVKFSLDSNVLSAAQPRAATGECEAYGTPRRRQMHGGCRIGIENSFAVVQVSPHRPYPELSRGLRAAHPRTSNSILGSVGYSRKSDGGRSMVLLWV
ncbi:hypothetical protein C8F04DRAFT_1195993 [Mycena alexandri]|uniref:Uncharacterized protein n=1 Tax=Mycena alexandri TaxID=1745969 RepID=A0AAD6WQ51_9AGAR|nr:hypothetical protein C8F04DRAFT_1195993 [Mycena alexandri]